LWLGVVALFVGCQTPAQDVDLQTYQDPGERFTLSYPEGWRQTRSKSEIQFWDDLSDGQTSVKITLTQGGDEASRYDAPETIEESAVRRINGVSVVVEKGQALTREFVRYRYQLPSEEVVLVAVFKVSATEEIKAQAEAVMSSLKWGAGKSE